MKCCHFGASSVYTIQPCTRLQCHFIQIHIGRGYACLAVTCHLHFWQNDWDLSRATAVTRGWNRYSNKSQHSKLMLENKILQLLLQGFEPMTFQSQVWRSNLRAILLPGVICIAYVNGISHVFIYERIFTWMSVCCCCNLIFYDRSECVMSVLGTTKHS